MKDLRGLKDLTTHDVRGCSVTSFPCSHHPKGHLIYLQETRSGCPGGGTFVTDNMATMHSLPRRSIAHERNASLSYIDTNTATMHSVP